MSNIGQRVFVLGGNQLYMTLANEEFVRPLGISNNWTKLRLGIMCAITPDGTNNLGGATLLTGVCSGSANPYGSSNTTNFIGMNVNGNIGGTFTYTANSGFPYYNSGAAGNYIKRVGNTTSNGSIGGSLCAVATNTGSLQRRTILYTDITKGSPNYTIAPFGITTATIASDWSFTMFLDGIEQAGTPLINGIVSQSFAATTVATSELAGNFDTFDLFWSKAQFPLEIYAMAAYRLQ